jgi:hypothetical protein
MNANIPSFCLAVCLGLTVAAHAIAETAALPPGPQDAEIDMILDQPLPEAAYGKRSRCLSSSAYRSVEVLDASHLLFWGSRGRVWLNQLRYACPGLRKDQILSFSVGGNRICAFDRMQGASRGGAMSMPSAPCNLEEFELISQAQAIQLREWLKRRRPAIPPPPAPTPAPAPAEG